MGFIWLNKAKDATFYHTADEAIHDLKDKDLTSAYICSLTDGGRSDGNSELFLKACKQNLTGVVAGCLSPINNAKLFAHHTWDGHSALYFAAHNNNPEMVGLLLENNFEFTDSEHQKIVNTHSKTDKTPNVIRDLMIAPVSDSQKENRIKTISLLIKHGLPYPENVNAGTPLFNQVQGNIFRVSVLSQQPLLMNAIIYPALFSIEKFAELFAKRFGPDHDQNFMYVACVNNWQNVIQEIFSCHGIYSWPAGQKILDYPATVSDEERAIAIENYVKAIGFENLLKDPNLDKIAYDYGDSFNTLRIAKDIDGFSKLCAVLQIKGTDALRLYIAITACKEAHAFMGNQQDAQTLSRASQNASSSNEALCGTLAGKPGLLSYYSQAFENMPTDHGLGEIKQHFKLAAKH